MKFLPAIDLLDGQAVRLTQGDYGHATQFGPVASVIDRLLDQGIDALHLVDLNAARDPNDLANRALIASCVGRATKRGVMVQVGGGIRDHSVALELLALGATRVIVGTGALGVNGWIHEMDDQERAQVVISLDFRIIDDEPRVVSDAWRQASPYLLDEAVNHFAKEGFVTQLITPVARDGMASGPDLVLYQRLVATYPIALIASGGIRNVDDLAALGAIEAGPGYIDGAIVGTALYRGSLTVNEGLAACSR
jgi:phosphoribosylformimino-5-aminoimidazole carboxamide ribotide isomerase